MRMPRTVMTAMAISLVLAAGAADAQTLLNEDFATFVPTGWTRSRGILANPTALSGTTSNWVADGFANVGTVGATKVNIYGTGRQDWLFTPQIDLGAGGSLFLEFDLALTVWNTQNPGTLGVDDKFAVVISTDGGATWYASNTLRLWGSTTPISHTGERVSIDLSAYSGVIKLGFYGESTVSNADNDLFVDDVWVGNPTSPPGCTTPIAPADGAVHVQAPNGSLSWNTAAYATGYKLYFGTDDPPTNIENRTDLGNATTYPYSGIAYSTTHYWKVIPYNPYGDATGCDIWDFTSRAFGPPATAHWTFYEGTGNVLHDVSGNGWNGTIFGATWINGCNGGALHFDGLDDRVTTSLAPVYANTQSFTWEVIAKYDTVVSAISGAILGFESTDAGQVVILQQYASAQNPGHVRANPRSDGYAGDGGQADLFSLSDLRGTGWHHIALVRDRANRRYRLYVDHELQQDVYDANSNPINAALRRLGIGCQSHNASWDKFFRGDIDEIRITDAALTTDEFLPAPGSQTLLSTYAPVLHLWPLDYLPRTILSMTDLSALHGGDGQVIDPQPVSPASLTGELDPAAYLNLSNASPPFWGLLGVVWPSAPSVDYFSAFDVLVYGREAEDSAGPAGHKYLQYWFFYPFNKGANVHEGDWEGIQIHLDETDQPDSITYSWHEHKTRYKWNQAPVELEGTHPVVSVAMGTHASYPNAGLHMFQPSFPWVMFDNTPNSAQAVKLRNGSGYSLATLSESGNWIDFPGHWGELCNVFPDGYSGPTGPKQKDRWDNPYEWESVTRGSMDSTNDILVALTPVSGEAYARVSDGAGNSVGPDDQGGFQNTLADVSIYILPNNPANAPALAIVGKAPGTSYDLGAKTLQDASSFSMQIADRLFGRDQIVIAEYHSVSVQAGGSAFVTVGEGIRAYDLQVDEDGDGAVDETQPPDVFVDPALEIPTADASCAGSTLHLSWNTCESATAYRVYRGYEPSFQSGGTTNFVGQTAATSYDVSISDMGEGDLRFFVVRSVDEYGVESFPSNVIGAQHYIYDIP